MGRKQDRKAAKRETNAVEELCKVQRKYLPHHVTENEYLERLDSGEMEKVIHQIVYGLIRRRTFEDVRCYLS